jgi:hypothetical protein
VIGQEAVFSIKFRVAQHASSPAVPGSGGASSAEFLPKALLWLPGRMKVACTLRNDVLRNVTRYRM